MKQTLASQVEVLRGISEEHSRSGSPLRVKQRSPAERQASRQLAQQNLVYTFQNTAQSPKKIQTLNSLNTNTLKFS